MAMESIKGGIFYVWCLVLYVFFAVVQIFLPLIPTLFFKRLIRGSGSRQRDPKRVVVVGGGFTGVAVAKDLESDPAFDVTLLDGKRYFEFTPSLLRTFVEPAHTGAIQIEYPNFLHKTKVLNQVAVEVNREYVVSQDKQQIPYDYLVLATGSSYAPVIGDSGVISGRDCPAGFNNNAVKIQKAQKILIIGGGVVGVELAGEIISKYPNKQVTIATSSDRLIPRSPAKAIRYAEQFFRNRGVQLLFNERVERNSNSHFVTSRGVTIEADLAFMCIGILPNSQLLRTNTFMASLNEKGFVNVNPHLQVEGCDNVFSAGDLVSVLEEKLAQSAEAAGHVIADNIILHSRGASLKTYTPTDWPMLISLGKLDCVLIWKSFSITGFIPALLKEFVEWKELIRYY